MFNLDGFLRDCLLTPFSCLLSEARKSILGKHCCMLPLFLNFPFAVRDRILGRMDISSDLIRLSYAIFAYVSSLYSV